MIIFRVYVENGNLYRQDVVLTPFTLVLSIVKTELGTLSQMNQLQLKT